ncbi:MAG: phospholipid/cholesterol/gamma-HCH transport system substrate-binding protein [Pseudonocardiales bacterium]|jgi:phospholipid/cholesterol/gamma-HCH transport system substrate-binding protein|nr:phospholipid/cholesterol/gamma-HCH transport system substrate-binding protein [Pseudonocardiales bacterium]
MNTPFFRRPILPRPVSMRQVSTRPVSTQPSGSGRRLLARLAAGLLAATTLAGCGFHGLYTAPLPGGADLGSHPYRVLVDFANVLDLVPQSSVKVNDVTVGRVEKVTLIDWHARVQLVVNGDVQLPANAYAQIRQTSLLGEKFVSLSYPPSGEVSDPVSLADAAHAGYAYPLIGINRTGATPEVEEVLGALSLLLNGGGLEQIKTITHELDQALSGHTQQLRDLLSQAKTFSTALNSQRGRILTAIDHLDALSRTLNNQKQVLAKALDTMPQAIKVLADEKDQFVTLLKSLDTLSTVAVRVINGSTDNFVSSLRSLDPVLTQLTRTGSDLPKSLELLATYPFPKTAVDGVRGDYTNLFVSADLNLTDLLDNLLSPAPPGTPAAQSPLKGSPALVPGAGG